MRNLPAGHCGGCGDPFARCTCDAMGVPAPKSTKLPLAEFIEQFIGRPLRPDELTTIERYEASR